MRILIFLSIVLAVLGGSCWYMARRSLALCPALPSRWVYGFFLAFAVLLPGVMLLHRTLGPRGAWMVPVHWLVYVLFSFMSTYLVYLLAADLLQTLFRLAHGPAQARVWAFGAALGGAVLSVSVGMVQALRPPILREITVPVADLPQGLEGFRIAQISDLHLGPLTGSAGVDRLVARTRELRPDLVAVTGDLVDGEADAVADQVRRMADLGAPHGTFFVMGNHEYFSGGARWPPILRGMGWTVLTNAHAVLEHGGARLVVAGLPDPSGRSRHGGARPELGKALEGAPAAPVVLLYHPPSGVAAAERAGVVLQLSGHTHGGQYFPWSLLVPRLWAHPRGLSRVGRLWVYTSVGTGFWGPPNRFLVPPELTVLTLRRS